jgi:hypothetical protein
MAADRSPQAGAGRLRVRVRVPDRLLLDREASAVYIRFLRILSAMKTSRRAPLTDLPPVAEHVQYLAECPRHGTANFLTYLGNRCQLCHQEGLIAKGLVKP